MKKASEVRMNPLIERLVCSKTGDEVAHKDFRKPIGLSPAGAPVEVRYDIDSVRKALDKVPFAARSTPGMWRYAPLLPVSEVPPHFAADVGGTPVFPHPELSQELGGTVHMKNEGANPTGSFKDRGLAMAIALGTACGARQFCLPTQGNAGVAGAFFSRRMGVEPCIVHMPEGYQDGVYHRSAAFLGAEVEFFGENIAATGKRMREAVAPRLASGELVDISTFFEPGRLEGKKTMGLEIFEHFKNESLPDYIFYPTGGGTGLVGIWKAFSELKALGLLTGALPKMVAVQSERCDPVVRSFAQGLDIVEPVQSKGTVADGMDVPGAIMGHGILRVLRESGGTAIAVSEADIVEAFTSYGQLGIPGGYESAATWAAAKAMKARGELASGASVLLLNTGSHLIPIGQARSAAG